MTTSEKGMSYGNIHNWIYRKFGKASRCESETCTSVAPKRFEWALRHGCEYSKNKSDYIQLCPSCHRKYDETELSRLRKSKAHAGKHFGEATILGDKRKCMKCQEIKPLDEFYNRSGVISGKYATCKVCIRIRDRERRKRKKNI